jgi:hypothetical protein
MAKSDALNVLLLHVLDVGHFDKFTKDVPNGDVLTIVFPSPDISYRSAYNSNRGVPLGARHAMDIRN